MLRIGIVSGEASGDLLASELIYALKDLSGDIEFEGIGGPLMESAGCKILYTSERLAVMGLLEVTGRYVELLSIRRNLTRHFISNPPDIFIGVDSPDFNLDLEIKLRKAGIRTVHYVGPTVWAWRSGRMGKIRKAVDLMLVLFPFEGAIYQHNKVPVEFVGHPLADQSGPVHDKSAVRNKLEIDPHSKVVAIMPGSRKTEIERMLPAQLETVVSINATMPGLVFVTSVLDQQAADFLDNKVNEMAPEKRVTLHVFKGRSRDVLSAADVGLLTSGTITLEAMLCHLPMVVMYQMNWLSYRILKSMVRVNHVSLPNLLAGHTVVPEFLQDACQPDEMGRRILKLLDENTRHAQITEFERISSQLKQGASQKAASAVLGLLH